MSSPEIGLFTAADDVPTSPTLVSHSFQSGADASAVSPTLYNHPTWSHSICLSAIQVAQDTDSRFKPFRTPGPASTISGTSSSSRVTFNDLKLDVRHSYAPRRGALEVPEHTRLLDAGRGLPAETHIRVPSASAVDTNVGVNGFRELYASPGIIPRAPKPVYFGSPIEDCLDSGSPSTPFSLDLVELDFRWTAFDRKSVVQDTIQIQPKVSSTTSESQFNQFQSGEHVTMNKSPSPDDDCFHFQTVLNATKPDTVEDQQVKKSCKASTGVRECFPSFLGGTPFCSGGGEGFGMVDYQLSQQFCDGSESWSE